MGLNVYRYPGERVQVGAITIRVGRTKGQQVQLLIEAPADVKIDRPTKDEDLADRIAYADLREARDAAKMQGKYGVKK